MSTVAHWATAILAFGLILGLDALSCSPALHSRLCPQANQPGHHCAVTIFAGGVAGVLLAAFSLSAPAFMTVTRRWPPAPHRAAPLFGLCPCRAPPAGSDPRART